ncbi:hypothetical protein O6H91_Y517800 [Diphasiastrum complanatum]|nr:hypothetical protein O6H91_Y517800 [Diphasiastrum complanatum]
MDLSFCTCRRNLLMLLVIIALASSALMAQGWPSCYRKIIVGGNSHWKFGFNYSNWALQTGPFHVGDTLVFYYKPDHVGNLTIEHNVYLFKHHKDFQNCNFSTAIEVGDPSKGKRGFKFVLRKPRPYYFGCAARAGLHCTLGMMKFGVRPACGGSKLLDTVRTDL